MTEQQKQLLKDLEDTFINSNISANTLVCELLADSKEYQNLLAHKEAMELSIKVKTSKAIREGVDFLNKELAPLGVQAKYRNNTVTIFCENRDDQSFTLSFYYTYKAYKYSIEAPCNFHIKLPHDNTHYLSIAQIFAESKVFKDLLFRLHKVHLRIKK